MTNAWKNNIPDMFAAIDAAAVIPSDTVDLSPGTRAIYIGGAGDIKVDMKGGGTVTFVAPAVGIPLPFCVTRIYATGTTATNILALK